MDNKNDIDKQLLETNKRLNLEASRVITSLRNLEKSLDSASNDAIDKVKDGLIKVAKNSSLLSDELKDQIKTARGATLALEALAKKTIDVKDLEQEFQRSLKSGTVDIKKFSLAFQEMGVRLEEGKTDHEKISKTFSKLTAETSSMVSAIESSNKRLSSSGVKLTKELSNMKSQVATNVAGFFTLASAVNLATKSATKFYELGVDLAGKGMLGAMKQVVSSSVKLNMTTSEVSELLGQNRSVITAMGGGARGVEDFIQAVTEGKKGLEVFGKDSAKIYSGILKTLTQNGAGFGNDKTRADTITYANQLKDQFRVLNGLFGDTAEEFQNHYDQLLKEEGVQAKLLTLSGTELRLAMQEIITRNENLRLLGLSNVQIQSMNKTLESLYNPNKNRQAEAMKERYMGRASLKMSAESVRGLGGENAALADRIDASLSSGKFDQFMRADADTQKSMIANNPEMQQLAKDMYKLEQARSIERGKTGGSESTFDLGGVHARELAGSSFSNLASIGKSLTEANIAGQAAFQDAGARSRALELAGVKEVRDAQGNLSLETTELAKQFGELRNVVDKVRAIMDNPLLSALGALVAGFGSAFIFIKGGIGGAMSSIANAAKLFVGGIGGVFKGLFSFLKKIPGLGAALAGIEGAWEGLSTDTDDYYDRMGVEKTASFVPQWMKDTGVRTAGVLSDVGSAAVKGVTFGAVDLSKDFSDKQAKAAKSTSAPQVMSTQPQAPRAVPSAASGASGLDAVQGWKDARPEVKQAILDASAKTGVSPQLLAATAAKESGLGRNLKASTSSATGSFQFIDSTWLSMMNKHGAKYGYDTSKMSKDEILNLRYDEKASALMGAQFIKDNQAVTGDTSAGGSYLAHFLGPAGAKKVLSADPSTPISSVVGQQQINANPGVFKNMKTAGDLVNWSQNSMNKVAGGSINTGPITTAAASYGASSTTVAPATSGVGVAAASDTQLLTETQKQTALLQQNNTALTSIASAISKQRQNPEAFQTDQQTAAAAI